jgi:uncharacterized protein YutE (UPF0331/DUF86 family)
VDTTPIGARLSQIDDALQLLREIQGYSRAEFVQNPYLFNTAEHQFQVAIQAALDIGGHILAELGVAVPADYADIFVKLGEVGVLPQAFADRLVNMAKFRNVLVHLYLEVDLDKVYAYLQNNLDDLDEFARHVVRFIERQAS